MTGLRLGEHINWTHPEPEPEPPPDHADTNHAELVAEIRHLHDQLAAARAPRARRVERDGEGNITRVVEEAT